MVIFRYEALTQSGDLVRGRLAAPSPAAAIARLNEQGLLPIDASTESSVRSSWSARGGRGKGPLSGRVLALLSLQLSRLLKAGLPIDRALAILIELSDGERLKRALQNVFDQVRDGTGFADALYAQGKQFPETFVTLVRAGELSGVLQDVLAETGGFLAQSELIRQKVVSAMVYPAILIIVAGLSIGVILTSVLPQFEPMFKEAGSSLPALTQIVLTASDVLRHYCWLLLGGMLVAAFAWRAAERTTVMRAARDGVGLKIPVLKDIILRFELSRFCRTLGVMLANGVAAPAALSLAASAIGNSVLADTAASVAVRFREGEGLSGPLSRSRHFPQVAVQMIRIGEETGRLEDMLSEVAVLFDQEVQRMLERLLAALVPTLTVAMGLLIGLIVAAVMTALMTVNALAV